MQIKALPPLAVQRLFSPLLYDQITSFATIPKLPKMDTNPPDSGYEFIHVDPLSESVVSLVDDVRDENNDAVAEEKTKVLPDELSSRVIFLTCESSSESSVCDVYIVGPAHVSGLHVVFLELCSSRVSVLSPQNLKIPTLGEMVEMWKKQHNLFGILYSWFLAKVASKLEIFPGSEFRVAFEEAMKYGGRVILGDRPLQLKEMDDVDVLTLVIQEISKEFPNLMETLVHEWDQYMSSRFLRVAAEHCSVVVVGKGYLQGIKNHWKQPVSVNDLTAIPSTKPLISAANILPSFGVAVAGVAIISGIYPKCKK